MTKSFSQPGKFSFAAAMALVSIFSGCMVGPNYKPPQPDAPGSWVGTTNASASAGSVAKPGPVDLTAWWKKFQDPELTALVEKAVHTNLDVQIAQARLRQARASFGVDAGQLWPNLTANGSYSYGRSGQAPYLSSPNSTRIGLNADWPLDFFGGTRRQLEADRASVQGEVENIHDIQVAVAAEVVLDYLQLRSAQEQIAIARENLQAEQHTADLTRQRLRAGFVSSLDVANADAQAASTASAIPVLETDVAQIIYALSVLLGRPPADLLGELSAPAPVPSTPPEVPVGLPSELLRRRPDVRHAEANLHRAAAEIGVATSDFFPKFSLTGSVNYQNNMLRDLLTANSRSWVAGPSVTWPIFRAGSIAANVRVQKALRDESYLTYQKTVLTALQDVENALVAFANEWTHRNALSDAVDNNRRALEISSQLYTQGTTDFLNVLNAQRSLYGSQTALAQTKLSISADLVAIYKALGGGWEEESR